MSHLGDTVLQRTTVTKQCQIEGQDYSSKSKILALQNFICTIVIMAFGVKKGFKVLVQFVLGEIFGFRLFFSLV